MSSPPFELNDGRKAESERDKWVELGSLLVVGKEIGGVGPGSPSWVCGEGGCRGEKGEKGRRKVVVGVRAAQKN